MQLWKAATKLLKATGHNGSHLRVLSGVLCPSSKRLVSLLVLVVATKHGCTVRGRLQESKDACCSVISSWWYSQLLWAVPSQDRTAPRAETNKELAGPDCAHNWATCRRSRPGEVSSNSLVKGSNNKTCIIALTVQTLREDHVWKFDALREHPLGKGEATWHLSSWHSFMHRRLVENILLVARETCALWSIWITIFYWSSDSTFCDILRCHWSVLTWMWCIDQFYILFWILLESGIAYCLSWRYLHWLDIEIVYGVFDTEKLILSKGWEQTAETLGEEFKLAESTWWREATTLWVWTMRCIGIVRTITIFGHLICLKVLW